MIQKIEHIGFAVSEADERVSLFEKLLDANLTKSETVESEKVRTWFFQAGESQIELLESLDEEGVISKFIARRGEGMHHIAFLTDNLQEEILRLKNLGFEFINETPKQGADNKRIVFLHPKSTAGVLIELCEEIAR
jgi:methylmalonyl-CoA/ethylmalonyl-CoA epimerase